MSENLFDPITQAREAGACAIDEPIINRPYEEPGAYWQVVDLDTGEQTSPTLIEGRRPAGYFFDTKKKRAEGSKMHEEFIQMHCVNDIRNRVREWRKDGYRGVTQITRTLLEHWRREEREQPLFFCQLEAVETIIWLHEAHAADRQGLFFSGLPSIPQTLPPGYQEEGEQRLPLEQVHPEFRRYCCKMATGTGKTVVMAMIIAWSTLNKIHYPTDTRFSDAVLVVAPGITVKDRLSVLVPGNENDYYTKFDLVPPALRDAMGRALIHVLHRQEMAILDDTKTRRVTKLGRESDNAFANRLLKRQLGSK